MRATLPERERPQFLLSLVDTQAGACVLCCPMTNLAEAKLPVYGAHHREVSGIVTSATIGYLRRRQGEPGVRSLLEIAGETRELSVLEDEQGSSFLGSVIALFDAAELLTGDPAVARRTGEYLAHHHVAARGGYGGGPLRSPAKLLRRVVREYAGWWQVAGVDVVSAGPAGAVVEQRIEPPNEPNLHVCLHAQGVLAHVTVPFGLPPATIAHPICQLRGADACRFELAWPTWRPVANRLGRSAMQRSVVAEVEHLQERISELESTVAELVSTDDLDEALSRIAARAGAAVGGQRFLLMVRLPEDTSPRVHSAGFAHEEATRIAQELVRATPDVVPDADRVVAEVASARRRYGWLAAYPEAGADVLPSDHAQLEAYARLAAAALDAATALADARRGDETAQAVLALARELTAEPDETGVAQRVVEAVSTAVGSDRASLLLLDDDEDVLRTVAVHGFGESTADALAFEVVLDAAPALAVALTEPTARLYTEDDPDPWVRQLAVDAGAAAVAVAPMIVRERFLGLLVANWSTMSSLPTDREPVFAGLTGLADHAGVALAGVRAQELTARRASFDAATGLADQASFDERLTLHLADRRRASTITAVCSIDLDGLPDVNQHLWGPGADPVLVEVAARIRHRLRETDAVARVSARELVVLLCDLSDRSNAEQVAVDLVESLTAPIQVEHAEVDINATIGIAFPPDHGTSPGELLQAARTAMREARSDEVVYRVWQPPTAFPGF